MGNIFHWIKKKFQTSRGKKVINDLSGDVLMHYIDNVFFLQMSITCILPLFSVQVMNPSIQHQITLMRIWTNSQSRFQFVLFLSALEVKHFKCLIIMLAYYLT